MKLEEALIRLNEEELLGKGHSVDIEQSSAMKSLGTLANMINEAMENLRTRDRLLYVRYRRNCRYANGMYEMAWRYIR